MWARRLVGGRQVSRPLGGARWLSSLDRRPSGWWKDAENRKRFLDDAAASLRIHKEEDWKKLTVEKLKELGGASMLQVEGVGGSISQLLRMTYPEMSEDASIWRSKVPQGFWQDQENRRRFLARVMEEKGIRSGAEWRKVSTKEVREMGGSAMLALYDGSLRAAVSDLFPEQRTEVYHFRAVPASYWDDEGARRTFMDDVKEKMHVKSLSDWQRVSVNDIRELGGAGLLLRYSRSLRSLLKDVYGFEVAATDGSKGGGDTETLVMPYKSRWAERDSRRRFMDEVAAKYEVRSVTDWRRVGNKQIEEMGGARLLQRFGSVLALLRDSYPEVTFRADECRPHVPESHWASRENCDAFMKRLAEAQGVRGPQDWRQVMWKHVTSQPGAYSFLKRYNNSLEAALRDFYRDEEHEIDWQRILHRPSVPQEHWESEENVRQLLREVAEKMEVKEKADWYRISLEDVRSCGGAGLLRKMRLVDALRLVYPEEEWDAAQCSASSKRSRQRQLKLRLAKVFRRAVQIEEEYRHEDLTSAVTRRALELDLFVPEMDLGVEYNGVHHYESVNVFGPVEMYRKRDEEKRRMCEKLGIRLLVVPYWWDGSAESLCASLVEKFPSLMREWAEPSLLSAVADGRAHAIPESRVSTAGVEDELPSSGVLEDIADPTGLLITDLPTGRQAAVWNASQGALAMRATGRLLDAKLPKEMPGTDVEGYLRKE